MDRKNKIMKHKMKQRSRYDDRRMNMSSFEWTSIV